MSALPMRDLPYLRDPDDPRHVTSRTYLRLHALAERFRWTPMLNEGSPAGPYFRAWLRATDGRRIWGRPELTAELAARSLLAKIEPLVPAEASA